MVYVKQNDQVETARLLVSKQFCSLRSMLDVQLDDHACGKLILLNLSINTFHVEHYSVMSRSIISLLLLQYRYIPEVIRVTITTFIIYLPIREKLLIGILRVSLPGSSCVNQIHPDSFQLSTSQKMPSSNITFYFSNSIYEYRVSPVTEICKSFFKFPNDQQIFNLIKRKDQHLFAVH